MDEILTKNVDFESAVLREKVRFAVNHLATMQESSFIVALVLAFTMGRLVPLANIALWVGLVLAVVLSRIVYYYQFRKVRDTTFAAKSWENAFLLLALASGIVWGLASILIFPTGDPVRVAFFLIVIGGLSASAAVSHASLKWGPAAWMVPALLFAAVRCAIDGGDTAYSIVFLIVLCLIALLRLSLKQNETITSFISARLDITERRQSEDALKQANRELAASNKELDAFVYSVSHDLRAPLFSISGFAQILIDDYADKLDAKCNDYLVHILNGTIKLSGRIDALLELSRISRQDIVRTQIDLSRIAASIVNDLRETDINRQVNVVIDEGVNAFADLNLIKVAMSNLFENAWKFTSKTPDAHIQFGFLDKKGKTVYFITDNGAGFNPALANKMFLPFHRLHSDTEFQGTGIGLAIVERVILRHNGKIWAEGAIGKGTTVYFTLD